MSFRPRAIWALFALIFVSSSLRSIGAAAPEPTGTIRVRLSPAASVPVSASVELRASASSLRWTDDIEEPNDAALFFRVPPGAYTLTVRLPGFREMTASVDVRMATLLDFVVEPNGANGPTGEPSLRLLRAGPVEGDVHAFDQSMLATFPADDALAAVVETAVAPLIVDRMSTGGLWLAEPARLGGYGTSWRQTSIVLGAIDVTDPVRIGTPLVRAPQDATDSLLVSTTLLPASVAGPGPLLTIVPKTAAADRYIAAEVAAIPSALRGTNSQPGLPSIARFAMHRDGNAQLGAPLGSGAGLFVAVRHIATDRLERDDATRLRTRVNSLAASSSIASGTNSRLRLAATVDRAALPHPGRARFRDRTGRESDTFATGQASWDRWTTGGTAWSAALGLAQGTFSPAVDARTASSLNDAGTIERLVDGPVPILFESVPGTRRRWNAGADVTPALGRFTRRHLLSAGATLAYSTADTRGTPTPPVAELVGGHPARIWEYAYGGPETRWTSTELAAYVTDRLLLHERVRVDVGLRMESMRGSARSGDAISWQSLSPRLASRWLLTREGGLALFAGYARYQHRLPLDDFAYGDPAALAGRVYRWHDLNADRVPQDGERGALVAFTGPCCTAAGPVRIDPDLQQPYTRELAAGVDLRIGGWPLRVQGVYREERHLIASVNTGVTPEDYVLRYILDLGEPFRDPPEERLLPVYDREPSSFGRDAYWLTNPSAHSAEYLGYDLIVEGPIARRLRTRFEGSLYHGWAMGGYRGFRPTENDHGLVGELFENPNAQTGARGNTFLDRTYVIKWWASYEAPRQYVVSAVARYQDGQPFGRLAVVPDLNQGAEAIYGFRPGRSRFTFTGSLDARLEKMVRIGRTRIIGALEIFNLLNMTEEVEEDVATGPSFRRPTAVQPPRAARVGLRFTF